MIEINNLTNNKINSKKIKIITEKFLRYYKKSKFSISLAIVSDQKIKDLNRIYRKNNKVTDVLSFSDLNEIIIDFNQIKRQAKENKKTVELEFIFILIHGLLHLVGYDDSTEKDRLKMIKLGEDFLKKI